MANHETASKSLSSYERAVDHSKRCPWPTYLTITDAEKDQIQQAVNNSEVPVEDQISAALDYMLNILIEQHSNSRSVFSVKDILDYDILECDSYWGENDLLERPMSLPYVAGFDIRVKPTEYNVDLPDQAKSNLAKIWKLTQISHKMILRTAALLAANEINTTAKVSSHTTDKLAATVAI